MIIDAHVHITEDGKWLAGDYDASLQHLVDSLENSPVDKAVLLPIVPYISNKYVAEACRRYPEKLIGFASVNPLESKAPATLEKARHDYGLKGLKLHPGLQKFELNDPGVVPVFRMAASLDMPVVIDTFARRESMGDHTDLDSIIGLAAMVPTVKIIVTHLGGFNYDYIPGMAAYPNLYFDISFILRYIGKNDITKVYDEIVPVMERVGSTRMIYGSDHPEADLQEYFMLTEQIFDHISLPAEDRNNIYSGTLRSLGIG